MHAPPHACKSLYRLHPHLRLAWAGRAPKYPGELNPGSFAIVQLYHIRDVGSPSDPTTYRELWHSTVKADAYMEPERVRIDRGPIFSKEGEVTPDWDKNTRVPIFVMTLDEKYVYPDGEPFKIEDVQSGKFLGAIRTFLTPIKDRKYAADKAKYRRLKEAARGMSEEMGKQWWWMGQQTGAAKVSNLAYKHVRHQVRRQGLRKERLQDD